MKGDNIKVKILLILATLAMATSPVMSPKDERTYTVNPTVDLSAIRSIICVGRDGEWEGSGFLIGPGILATANHIGKLDRCFDRDTQSRIYSYKLDPRHDFALMTGKELPTNIPYIKYNCEKFTKGEAYYTYGMTDYGQREQIFRMNRVVFTGDYSKTHDDVPGFQDSAGMGEFNGAVAPGMSGGPVLDDEGVAHAVVNAGDNKTTVLFSLADTPLCPPSHK
jgi:hypothetical protein